MEILTDYLIFLLKVFTIALAITIPLLIVIGTSKGKSQSRGKLSITNLSCILYTSASADEALRSGFGVQLSTTRHDKDKIEQLDRQKM